MFLNIYFIYLIKLEEIIYINFTFYFNNFGNYNYNKKGKRIISHSNH